MGRAGKRRCLNLPVFKCDRNCGALVEQTKAAALRCVKRHIGLNKGIGTGVFPIFIPALR